MRHGRAFRPAGFALAIVLLATGCDAATTPSAPSQPSPGESPAQASPPTSGADPIAKIRARIPNNVTSLDGVKGIAGYNVPPTGLVGGMWQRPLRDGSLRNDLAESVDVSADGLTYTFVLKEGAVYSDGTPVTSEDAQFAVDRHIRDVGPQTSQLEPIESLTTPDARTLVVKLKRPFRFLPDILSSSWLVIHPKSKIEADSQYFSHPVSAGPYIVEDWLPNTPTLRLKENPRYIGGPLMIQEIELVSVADAQSTVLQLATGALDWAVDLPLANATGIAPEVDLRIASPIGSFHVAFNTQAQGPVGEPLVRQAIALAIDREQISQTAWFGLLPAADSFVYRAAPEFEPGVLLNAGKPDIDAAKALLAQTEWPDGFDLNLHTWAPRDGHVATAIVVAEQLKAIGINVTVDPMEIAASIDRMNSGEWEAIFQGSGGYPGSSQMVNNYCAAASWGLNTRYDNPEACALARSALEAADNDSAKASLRQLYEIANRDMSIIPTTDRGALVGSRIDWDVFGIPERGFSGTWVVPTVDEWSAR